MGLLGDLAAMARGERPTGAARVALPARFAPRSTSLENTEAVPFQERARGEVQAVPTAARPAADKPAAKTTDAAPRTVDAAERVRPDRPFISEGIRTAASPELSAPRRMPASPPVEAAVPPADAVPRRDPLLANPAPLVRPAIQSVATVVQAPKQAASPFLSTPLSAPAIAARTPSPTQPTPTVIAVTIDRIDVRAPATPRPVAAPTSRPRPQPSVSLADYLSGQGRRR
jgi:hypothetical protein